MTFRRCRCGCNAATTQAASFPRPTSTASSVSVRGFDEYDDHSLPHASGDRSAKQASSPEVLHLDDNTIVAVVADHGEEFFEHGRAGHYKTLYDEVLHVPLLIRYPGHIPPGKIVKGQVRLMDVPTTLLELAGVRVRKPQSDADSVSLAAALSSAGEGTAPPLPAFGDLNATLASLRTQQGKVIWNLQTNRREFYDLLHDPGEHHAVAERGISKLADQLARWRSQAKKKDDESDSIELGDEEKSALKSLGYLVE